MIIIYLELASFMFYGCCKWVLYLNNSLFYSLLWIPEIVFFIFHIRTSSQVVYKVTLNILNSNSNWFNAAINTLSLKDENIVLIMWFNAYMFCFANFTHLNKRNISFLRGTWRSADCYEFSNKQFMTDLLHFCDLTTHAAIKLP